MIYNCEAVNHDEVSLTLEFRPLDFTLKTTEIDLNSSVSTYTFVPHISI